MNDLVDKVGSLLQSTQLTSQKPLMSASTCAMLDKVRKLVPPMLEKFHKGAFFLSDAAVLSGKGVVLFKRLMDKSRAVGQSGCGWWE